MTPATVPSQVTYGGTNVFVGTGWAQPGTLGRSFNAIHMAVIPKGPYRGMVLVLDNTVIASTVNPPGVPALPAGHGQAYQACAIIDPADVPLNNIRYRNFLVPIGDPQPFPQTPLLTGMSLFCSGHAWSQFGDLVFGGGTDFYEINGTQLAGGRLVYVWNPRLDCFWPGTQSRYYPTFNATQAGSPGPGEYVGMWVKADAALAFPRWYPTATLTHRLERAPNNDPLLPPTQRMLFLGGTETLIPPLPVDDMAVRTYEAFVVKAEAAATLSNLVPDEYTGGLTVPGSVPLTAAQVDKVWDGPGIAPLGLPEVEWLDEYPRCHLISTGYLFFSGYAPRGAWLDHDASPGSWLSAANQPGQPAGTYSSNWQFERHDGSAVLFPNLGGTYDQILRVGGADGFIGPTTDAVESFDAASTSSTWNSASAMPPTLANVPDGGRVFANLVILPTGDLLLVGGQYQGGSQIEKLLHPLLFTGGGWVPLTPNPIGSPRTYHSTAVLLPDGRVLLGGGDDRYYDYEIFSPPYLAVTANRPVNMQWVSPAPPTHPTLGAHILQHDTEYVVSFDPLPLGQEFTKVVLMAPCSTTHHSDMSQRYIEVKCTPDGNQVVFGLRAEQGQTVLVPGIYMMFFVTNTSVSHATWVMIQ